MSGIGTDPRIPSAIEMMPPHGGRGNTSCRTTMGTSDSRMPASSDEDRDGRSRHEDLEVVTGHYRGAHAGSAAKSGFTCYLSIGCSVGGRGGGGRRTAHPRIIEELLR